MNTDAMNSCGYCGDETSDGPFCPVCQGVADVEDSSEQEDGLISLLQGLPRVTAPEAES